MQAAVEPFMTNHAGLVTFLYYEAETGKIHQLDSLGARHARSGGYRSHHREAFCGESAWSDGFQRGAVTSVG